MIIDQIALTLAIYAQVQSTDAYTSLPNLNSPTHAVGLSYAEQARERARQRRAALSRDDYFAKMLATLPLRLRPGTDHRKDSRATVDSTRRCRSVIYETYVHLPKEHTKNLLELTLYYTNDGRRGLGGSHVAVIRCLNVSKPELAAVFIHEMGHIVDANYLAGTSWSSKSGFYDFDTPVPNDDPSVDYYRLSWDSEKKIKSTAQEIDFVSTYAMSDPFEDFAETYMFYRLHGGSFRFLAKYSSVLKAKYDFMHWRVFSGAEFGSDSVIDYMNTQQREYDATLVPFNLDAFFNEPQNY